MAVLLGAINKKTPLVYKGFTINFIGGKYRADSYFPREQFTDTNLAKLKTKINKHLR